MWKVDNKKIVEFKPSKMLREGAYPFRNVDQNQDVMCLFDGMSGDNAFVDSFHKFILL